MSTYSYLANPANKQDYSSLLNRWTNHPNSNQFGEQPAMYNPNQTGFLPQFQGQSQLGNGYQFTGGFNNGMNPPMNNTGGFNLNFGSSNTNPQANPLNGQLTPDLNRAFAEEFMRRNPNLLANYNSSNTGNMLGGAGSGTGTGVSSGIGTGGDDTGGGADKVDWWGRFMGNKEQAGILPTSIDAVSALGQGWLGFQNYNLAKDQLDFQKQAYATNLRNQARLTNADLYERQLSRWRNNPRDYEQPTDEWKKKNLLPES